MKFKKWLRESKEDNSSRREYMQRTVIYNKPTTAFTGQGSDHTHHTHHTHQNQTAPQAPQAPQAPKDTLEQVAEVLKGLSFNAVEDGFSGTPDYASPEQVFGTPFRQPDFYSDMLKELPNLAPELQRLCNMLFVEWNDFRNEVLNRLDQGRKQMDSGQQRPIHYAIPVRTIENADKTFPIVQQILQSSPDPSLNHLRKMFERIYRVHQALSKKALNTLRNKLNVARSNPASYESPSDQTDAA